MKRVEYFPKKMAEREAALVASTASGQDGDRPTAPGQFRSFAGQAAGLQAEMKGKRMKLHLTTTVAASVFVLAPGIIPAQEPASNSSIRAHREDRASTVSIVAEDHLTLARYFRDMASQEQAMADSYKQIAALYKENAPPQRVDLSRRLKWRTSTGASPT